MNTGPRIEVSGPSLRDRRYRMEKDVKRVSTRKGAVARNKLEKNRKGSRCKAKMVVIGGVEV